MSRLEIGLEVDGDISGALREVRIELARRMRRATGAAGREVQLQARSQTFAAFSRLGKKKLGNAWRGKLYPATDEPTLSPAYVVYSKAPKIVDAFERGATIVPRHGRFLAIPTKETGRNIRSSRKGLLTPALWIKENGVALRFVPMPYGGVLIADLQRFKRVRMSKRQKLAGVPKTFIARRQKPQVMFVLLRQTTLRKRLDIRGLAQRAGGVYRNTVGQEMAAS